ncbi:hypothetical protein WJX81_007613 [Elliptochloris bilobata]|uniref:Uncharacterized protein n=1 Tax=Elliptochloris bilobata TaxID=381761 RepID=A0AAW1R1U2_9CHLO
MDAYKLSFLEDCEASDKGLSFLEKLSASQKSLGNLSPREGLAFAPAKKTNLRFQPADTGEDDEKLLFCEFNVEDEDVDHDKEDAPAPAASVKPVKPACSTGSQVSDVPEPPDAEPSNSLPSAEEQPAADTAASQHMLPPTEPDTSMLPSAGVASTEAVTAAPATVPDNATQQASKEASVWRICG